MAGTCSFFTWSISAATSDAVGSSKSETWMAPITVQPWGAGRPTISSGTEFGIFAWNTAGIVIKDVNVYGAGASNTSGGIFFYNDRADGAKLDTSAAGSFVFTVTATDKAGNTSIAKVPYTVTKAKKG